MIESRAILEAVVSHAAASGHFDRVNQHEPKSAPGNGLHAAVWVASFRPYAAGSGLASTSMLFTMNVRIYQDMLMEPQDEIDPRVMAAVDQLMSMYQGDFTLDGLVRNVDIFGEAGDPLSGEAGYLMIDGAMCRVFTLTVPVIVNDVYDQEA